MHVVYEFDCLNCQSSYVGKTIRQTYRRFQEHGIKLTKEKEIKSHSSGIINNSKNLKRSDRSTVKLYNIFKKMQDEIINSKQNNIRNAAVK